MVESPLHFLPLYSLLTTPTHHLKALCSFALHVLPFYPLFPLIPHLPLFPMPPLFPSSLIPFASTTSFLYINWWPCSICFSWCWLTVRSILWSSPPFWPTSNLHADSNPPTLSAIVSKKLQTTGPDELAKVVLQSYRSVSACFWCALMWLAGP